MWRLPLPPRLAEQLKSDVADMRNTGERWGGALTAGLFLKEFVGTTPWVHVDIAGPSSADKDHGHVAKGGTGLCGRDDPRIPAATTRADNELTRPKRAFSKSGMH